MIYNFTLLYSSGVDSSPHQYMHLAVFCKESSGVHMDSGGDSKVLKKVDLHRAIACDNSADFKIINRVAAEHLFHTVNVLPLQFSFSWSHKFSARYSLSTGLDWPWSIGIVTGLQTLTGHRYGSVRVQVWVGDSHPQKNPHPWCGFPRVSQVQDLTQIFFFFLRYSLAKLLFTNIILYYIKYCCNSSWNWSKTVKNE